MKCMPCAGYGALSVLVAIAVGAVQMGAVKVGEAWIKGERLLGIHAGEVHDDNLLVH